MKIFNRLFIFMLIFLWALPSTGQDLHLNYLRDYPTTLTLPKGMWEISVSYGMVNDAIDIFDVREKELKNISKKFAVSGVGNYYDLPIRVNYGLTDKLSVLSNFTYRWIDYGSSELKVKSYCLGLRGNLIGEQGGFFPSISFDFGTRGNIADDQTFREPFEINYYLNKMLPQLSPKLSTEVNEHVWLNYETENTTIRHKIEKVDIRNMKDYNIYCRITLGKTTEYFYPNIFFEYGKNWIKTKVGENLTKNIIDYLPDEYKDRVLKLSDLDRHEEYWKIGMSLLIKTPFKTLTHIEYNYISINRGKKLDYEPINHILKMDINYSISKNVIFTIGGIYLHRQFNGVLPFMYNRYSQTTFDHKYGWAKIGLTFLFGK